MTTAEREIEEMAHYISRQCRLSTCSSCYKKCNIYKYCERLHAIGYRKCEVLEDENVEETNQERIGF